MTFYQRILDSGHVSPSVAQLLFGDDEDARKLTLGIPNAFPKTAYNICLLYSALIQFYLVSLAKARGCALSELPLPANVIRHVLDCWNDEQGMDLAQDETAFSFLLVCADSGDETMIRKGGKQLLQNVRDIHRLYMGNARMRNPISEDELLDLMSTLPLLALVSIDRATLTMTLAAGDIQATAKCSPFITFINTSAEIAVDHYTASRYILSSVRKGERDDELRFNTVELSSVNPIPRTKEIRRQVKNNENLLFLCKTMGITTHWYPIDETWCDFAFLKRLTDVSAEVIMSFMDINIHTHSEVDLHRDIIRLFYGTELYDALTIKTRIEGKEVENLLYELFITHGVFKTIWCLLMEPDVEKSSTRKLFLMFMDAFMAKSVITPEQYNTYIDKCDERISQHIRKLEGIVPKKTTPYKKRSCEIYAEWQTFYILKAAGLSNERLFADVETMLSVEDYFDKISNPISTLCDDLKSLLALLTSFYGALLRNDSPFNEDKYFKDLAEIRGSFNIAEESLESMFDRFIQVITTSRGNPAVSKLLGRDEICDLHAVINYKRRILSRADKHIETEKRFRTKNMAFISYSHKDMDKVKPCVERWRNMGYTLYFDEDKFKAGDNWKAQAEKAMRSDECMCVFVFMSKSAAVSKAVRWEMDKARAYATQKYPGDDTRQDRFIVPINLETNFDIIDTYLGAIAAESTEEGRTATSIRDVVHVDKIGLKYDGTLDAQVVDTLRERLYNENDGDVVNPEGFDEFELEAANFYAFLKYGAKGNWQSEDTVLAYFNNEDADLSRCVFPIVASLKETRIKRDNITLVGYEIIRGKGRGNRNIKYILSSRKLNVDDYYCVPNYRAVGDNCSWMIEPLLISHDKFAAAYPEDTDNA